LELIFNPLVQSKAFLKRKAAIDALLMKYFPFDRTPTPLALIHLQASRLPGPVAQSISLTADQKVWGSIFTRAKAK
jgi:hypothetical protein